MTPSANYLHSQLDDAIPMPGALDPGTITSPVSNTAVETTIFSQVVPAGKMKATGILGFALWGNLTTGLLPPTLTLRVKLGSSSMAVFTTAALLGSLTGKAFFLDGYISNISASSQAVVARVTQASSGIISLGTLGVNAVEGNFSVDTSVNQTFLITAQFGSAVASTSLVTRMARLQLI